MGGFFNRSPDDLLHRGLYLPAQAQTPQGETSTCSVGGLIDYFLIPLRKNMATQCSMIRQTRIKPHYPVETRVDRRPQLTQVLGPKSAKKLPEAKVLYPEPSWEQAKDKLVQCQERPRPQNEIDFRGRLKSFLFFFACCFLFLVSQPDLLSVGVVSFAHCLLFYSCLLVGFGTMFLGCRSCFVPAYAVVGSSCLMDKVLH